MEEKKVPLSENSQIVLPSIMIPSFRTSLAIERGVEKNILMKTWGGLGDQLCAEPTLRFALKTFKNCDVSLASECPEMFAHLKFKEVFDLRHVEPIYAKYFWFNTIWPNTHLQWEFMSHMIINCVDYPSLCAFRCMLPVADKELQCPTPEIPSDSFLNEAVNPNCIVLHPGKHWQSKTFPKWWWDRVIAQIIKKDKKPVIIGSSKVDDNRGTVDVETDGCIDLRNKTSVMETIQLLQNSTVLLTNDSAPLHMAATGNAYIGFVASAKHPDYIMHWRNGQFGWREQNLGLGGVWDILDYCPNKDQEVSAENVGNHLLDWLPEPETFADWAIDKC